MENCTLLMGNNVFCVIGKGNVEEAKTLEFILGYNKSNSKDKKSQEPCACQSVLSQREPRDSAVGLNFDTVSVDVYRGIARFSLLSN